MTLLEFLMRNRLAASRAEGRRAIQHSQIKVNDIPVTDADQELRDIDFIEFEKHFYRVGDGR